MSLEEIWQFVVKYWLQFVLGAIAVAITAYYKKVSKKIKDYLNFQKNKKKEALLKETNEKIDKSSKETKELVAAVLTEFKNELKAQNQKFQDRVEELHLELMEGFKRLDDTNKKFDEANAAIQTQLDALREGVLTTRFYALRDKSKMFIRQKWISPEDLELYEEEYLVYTSLGGNGKMDPWVKKVRALPNDPKQIPLYIIE